MAARWNREQFETLIRENAGLLVIDFYSDSCVPCKRLAPLLAELEEQKPDITIGKVNVAYEAELARELQVTATPTLLLYRDGREQERLTGAIRRNALVETIERYE